MEEPVVFHVHWFSFSTLSCFPTLVQGHRRPNSKSFRATIWADSVGPLLSVCVFGGSCSAIEAPCIIGVAIWDCQMSAWSVVAVKPGEGGRSVITEAVRRRPSTRACTHAPDHLSPHALAALPGRARLSRVRPLYQWNRLAGSY